jgi:hypothetical protein
MRSLAKDKFYQAAEPRKPRLRGAQTVCAYLFLAGLRKRRTTASGSLLS